MSDVSGALPQDPTPEDLRAVAIAALQRMRDSIVHSPHRPLTRASRSADVVPTDRPASTPWTAGVGLAASRTRWNEPAPISSVIGRMTHQRGWDGPAAMGSVLARWRDIVGPDLCEHCAVETFEDRRLIVRCTSTAWAKQLELLLPHIERRIDEEVGPGVVGQVIVRGPAAPSWKKGRYSVPGRGPRDTYG